ncbi:Uma2 family endonuclease [Streptomyces sp. NPDC048172]|uniref:Uma2 family endonuclease n=1 Tax=Streptomyces sp. NPDC048172 TaxID=3365505 RepID=UPI0037238398
MAESGERSLDELFELLERMPVPEGYKVEIVEGTVYMTPQRDVHWQTIRKILHALEARFGLDVPVLSDVRIDFSGDRNGFAPDIAKIKDSAEKGASGRWGPEDVDFIAEVISRGTAFNDYGQKKSVYATDEVPVYLIADPYLRRCRVFTQPEDGDYKVETTVQYGAQVDLTGTDLDLILETKDFPTERKN